ncbi:MAG: hypothetical protein KAX20_05065 [Candidatus Omnitrophica bacterium]|nr:hypothetical protein [Candidatus Omnitrophota bacterium]
MEHEHVFVSKELMKEIMPEIEIRMGKKLREKKETLNAMKLSEKSFGKLWESKEDIRKYKEGG